MSPEKLVVAAILISLGGCIVTLGLGRYRTLAGWVSFVVTTAAATCAFIAAVTALGGTQSPEPETLAVMPAWGLALSLHVDGLTSLFLILTATITVPAALYTIPYMRHYEALGSRAYYPHVLLFISAMYGLLSTTDMMLFFFVFWQMMTIPGYMLIRYDNRDPANARAAMRFMVMMQIACLVTMIGAEILAVEGTRLSGAHQLKYDFNVVSTRLPALLVQRPGLTALAFTLFLIGFGIKMGMWPFGAVWLPEAHPAAPSSVSAVLSGVMIKTGVYGLLRYFLCLVPVDARGDFPLGVWGGIVATLGTVTLLTGTSAALRQDYSKRLLAFHSIGQIGYILLACGTCMTMLAWDLPEAYTAASLALTAALLHAFNHGVFKGLLFLNAGSMLLATDTQNLNRMGGLWRYMPLTALTALTASLAISGFPLLNGFVSKWGVYVSALDGSRLSPFLSICAAIALLTSALTLASFVKFFGTSFLGRRSATVTEGAEHRSRLEVGWMMQLPQVLLALLCIVTGVFPAILLAMSGAAIGATHQGLGGLLANVTPLGRGPGFGVRMTAGTAGYAPLAVLGVLAAALAMAWAISRLGGARRRADAPWLCGYATDREEVRYTAHAFYSEIKRAMSAKDTGAGHGGA